MHYSCPMNSAPGARIKKIKIKIKNKNKNKNKKKKPKTHLRENADTIQMKLLLINFLEPIGLRLTWRKNHIYKEANKGI